jgi:hypothetical protein
MTVTARQRLFVRVLLFLARYLKNDDRLDQEFRELVTAIQVDFKEKL